MSSDLCAFSDASFANDPQDRKSMGGYIVFLGNSPISWAANKHRGFKHYPPLSPKLSN